MLSFKQHSHLVKEDLVNKVSNAIADRVKRNFYKNTEAGKTAANFKRNMKKVKTAIDVVTDN